MIQFPAICEVCRSDSGRQIIPDSPEVDTFRCAACGHTGYRGRTAIAELLVFDETFARLVVARAGVEELRAAALAGGMVELRGDGLAKARARITSVEEVMRVTGAG